MLFEQEVTERIQDLDVSPFFSVPSCSSSLFSTLQVGLLAPPRLCVRVFLHPLDYTFFYDTVFSPLFVHLEPNDGDTENGGAC
jgi:hypothetical protein